jgi:tetratricopeptide (TPR) repeat protein
MYKAFLAHSSTDKDYVERIARRLGRGRVLYDVQDFLPGQDFRDAIRAGLDRSALFVLFASTESLKSTWVHFEIDEAEVRRISGKLKAVLVFIIDPRLGIHDLPEWMRRARVLTQTRPTQAARVILSQLIYQTGAERQSLFFGREELLQDVAKELVPSGGQRIPQVIIASGLEGVGRRTLLRRALRDNLSLDFGPMIVLEETDGLDRLFVELLDETMELNTRADLATAIQEFRRADVGGKAALLSREIGKIADDNVATVLVDEGAALIDVDGSFRPEVAAVFEHLGSNKREPYLVLVQRRRPHLPTASFGLCRAAAFQVPPLSPDSTRRLLSQSLRAAGLPEPSANEIEELAPYLGGYPPAISLAVGFAKTYGFAALLADKSVLVDFKVRTFSRVVQRLGLGGNEQTIAKVLGIEPSLSVDVIATMTSINQDEVARMLRGLIDQSLVVHSGGKYSLASPIRDAVYRAFGLIPADLFSQMAQSLRDKYWKDKAVIPPIDAIDATIYTFARGGGHDLSEFADVILPSTLLKIATQTYNGRQWPVARDFAIRALAVDPNLDRATVILVKSLVRLAHEGKVDWSEAEKVLQEAERRRLRGRQYLRGFFEWKRGNLEAAVSAYQSAERAGDRSVGVFRDRADCLFRLGRTKEADEAIKVALDRYPRHSYIIDLAAEIAITRGDFPRAETLIRDLEDTDVLENFYHRRAALKAARKQFEAALEDAELAILRNPPLHEILAQHIDILIELGRFEDAAHRLDRLSLQFKGRNHRNAQLGLLCKLALRQGRWKEAEDFYQQLQAKDLPVHLGLLREILSQKSQDRKIPERERQEALVELEKIAANPRYSGAVKG